MHPNQYNGCCTALCLDLNPAETLWLEMKSSWKCSACSKESPRYSGNVFSLVQHCRKRHSVVIFFACVHKGGKQFCNWLYVIIMLLVFFFFFFPTDLPLHCACRIEECNFEHWSPNRGGGGAKPSLRDDATGWILLWEIPEGSPAVCRGCRHHPPQEHVHNASGHCASERSESTPHHLCLEMYIE